jgi:hypothetical protein
MKAQTMFMSLAGAQAVPSRQHSWWSLVKDRGRSDTNASRVTAGIGRIEIG